MLWLNFVLPALSLAQAALSAPEALCSIEYTLRAEPFAERPGKSPERRRDPFQVTKQEPELKIACGPLVLPSQHF